MVIDDIEYHFGILGTDENWISIIPSMFAIYKWAASNSFIRKDAFKINSNEYINNMDVKSAGEFILSECDGKIFSKFFIDESIEFISIYIKTGDYWIDVRDKFNVDSIYDLQLNDESIQRLMKIIDGRYNAFV